MFIQRCVSCFKTKFTFLLTLKLLTNDYFATYEANFEVFFLKTAEMKQ